MKDAERATKALLIAALNNLTDSQFLGFVAMNLQDANDPLLDHIATRIDTIALHLQAQDLTSNR